jgi:hypothetical protein
LEVLRPIAASASAAGLAAEAMAQIVNSRCELAAFQGISQASVSWTSVLSAKASIMITISVAKTPAVSNWLEALASTKPKPRFDAINSPTMAPIRA